MPERERRAERRSRLGYFKQAAGSMAGDQISDPGNSRPEMLGCAQSCLRKLDQYCFREAWAGLRPPRVCGSGGCVCERTARANRGGVAPARVSRQKSRLCTEPVMLYAAISTAVSLLTGAIRAQREVRVSGSPPRARRWPRLPVGRRSTKRSALPRSCGHVHCVRLHSGC